MIGRLAEQKGVRDPHIARGPDGSVWFGSWQRGLSRFDGQQMNLIAPAIEAVRQWKFEPAMKDGRPVAVQINVEVNFRLY